MIKIIKATYGELITFLKNPTDHADPGLSITNKVKKLFALLVIEVPVLIVLALLIAQLESNKFLSLDDHKMGKLMDNNGIWTILGLVVFLVPFIEELIFRLPLRFKKNVLLIIPIFIVSKYGHGKGKNFNTTLKSKWDRYFKFLFYFSTLLFAYCHLINYRFSALIIILSPILVAPQLLLGSLAGFMRVKCGFVWGFFLHALHNSIFLIPLAIIMLFSKSTNYITDTYEINIEEPIELTSKRYTSIHPDKIIFENVSMAYALATIFEKDELDITSNDKDVLKNNLNINVTALSDDIILDKKDIIKHLCEFYEMEVLQDTIESEVWILNIVDSMLLSSHGGDPNHKKELSKINGKLIMKNRDFDNFAISLTDKYKVRVINKTNNNDQYNVEIKLEPFENLNKQLNDNYGLSLTKSKTKIEKIIVQKRG